MRYTTKNDAIEREFPEDIREPHYDVDAIFAEAFAYRVDTDDAGNELLNSAGFELVVEEDEFSALTQKHARES